MLVESLGEIDKAKRNVVVKKKLHVHYWIHGLPFRMRFPKSKLYESIFTPIIIGLVVTKSDFIARGSCVWQQNLDFIKIVGGGCYDHIVQLNDICANMGKIIGF